MRERAPEVSAAHYAFAKYLAALLIENCQEETITVDMPDSGFAEELAREVKRLGFKVRRNAGKPKRMTIVRRPASP
ncbi:MAG TPA: hypothetical protein VG944_20780 [Fimbriimonas sp.]|nr:hypothetical protein [Fimbriimonas sp.]